MSQQRRIRAAKGLLLVASVMACLAGVEALTSGIVPSTHAVCFARNDCTPASPAVNCCNGPFDLASFANICQAQAACYYTCAVAPNWPPGCGIEW